MFRRPAIVLWMLLAALAAALPAAAQERQRNAPATDTTYPLPETYQPAADSEWLNAADAVMLLAALGLGAYLVLYRRSRKGVVALAVFSVAYFGFWREGCVCAIGSVQNVALAAFDSSYALPITVGVFFLLPIAFALFYGRVFCAGVCPLGALQELFCVKPLALPRWVDQTLGLLAYLYLAAGVLLAATGARFIICEYDPFVGFFRRSGTTTMLLIGAAFLLVGLFIGRPYCRWFCPYGVILSWAARFSKRRVTITPNECVQCHLCRVSCPVGAIHAPAERPAASDVYAGKRRVAWTLLVLPVLAAVGAGAGWRLGPALAPAHATVQLAAIVHQDEQVRALNKNALPSDEVLGFRRTGVAPSELLQRAAAIQRQFAWGTAVLGALLGLVVAGRLLRLSRALISPDYQTDPAACVGCARCYDHCPKEYERRGLVMPAAMAQAYQAATAPQALTVNGGEKRHP